jgi:hypothetical protein
MVDGEPLAQNNSNNQTIESKSHTDISLETIE